MVVILSVWVAASGLPTRSLAQQRAGGDIEALQKEIDRDETELASKSCVDACRALTSMKNAAERLCAIDPGPKCEDARDRVARATERVRGACPECAAATLTTKPEAQQTTPPPPPAPVRAGATAQSMPAQSAPRRGGCAGCAIEPSEGPLDPFALGLFVAAAVALRARGRRSSHSRSQSVM
jgi:hypothetical protein